MFKTLQNLLYIFQLEEYDSFRFLQWVKKRKKFKDLEKKKKLNWTLKARTLFVLSLIFNLFTLGKNPASALTLASYALFPFEEMVKIIFVSLAKIKIRKMKNLKVVGITGSFGKTSTKEILAQVLETRFKVLKTPQSYNTPLGIAKVILKSLSKEHEIFIVEMGAYKTGEIKTLCKIVKPAIGILTGITKQHLERFGDLKNIILAKFELIQALPESGLAIVNFDSQPCQNSAAKIKTPVIFYGTAKKPKKGNFLIAQDIKLAHDKTNFTLLTNLDEKANLTKMETNLLGRHNIINILASATTALSLKIDIQEIKGAVKSLTPIPHRLEITKRGETIIVDDAYNANPEGVKAAMEILGLFKNKPKVIVTPGLIELGNKQFEENFKMGKLIGETGDFVIIVGRTNKKALVSGAAQHKKVDDNLFWVPNLDEATKKIQELALFSAVILFENDLPDQYQ